LQAIGAKEGPFLQTLNCGCLVALSIIGVVVCFIVVLIAFGWLLGPPK